MDLAKCFIGPRMAHCYCTKNEEYLINLQDYLYKKLEEFEQQETIDFIERK